MSTFRQFYTRWRETPFPPGSQDNQLDELHAELALVDSWIAELLVPYAARGQVAVATPDVAGELERLRDRVAEIGRGEHELRPYREYLEVAANAYQSFVEATKQRGARHVGPATASGERSP